MNCPQIRKTAIQIPIEDDFSSHLAFSQYVVKTLGLPTNLKAVLYNKFGQPYLFNLDLMHLSFPKVDYSEQHYLVFTPTPSTADVEVVTPPNFVNKN